MDANCFEEIYDRIVTLVDSHNQKEVAYALGIKQSSVSAAKMKATVPSDWYITLHDKYGANIDWLRFGAQPMLTKDLPIPLQTTSLAKESGSDFLNISISVYYTNLIKKNSSMVYEKKEDILLPELFRKNADLVFFYNAKGMEPFLQKEAFVGVSVQDIKPISGEIFAIYLPIEGVIFRRLVIMKDEILLYSEQQNMPTISMSEENLKESLLGKVIWTLQGV